MNLVPASEFALVIGPGWLDVGSLALLGLLGPRCWRALRTLPGYAATPALSRLLARLVGAWDLDLEHMLRADGADES
jgi:hypothetical protein